MDTTSSETTTSYTEDHVEVREGLRVYTYDGKWGTVEGKDATWSWANPADPWWTVRYDDGSTGTFNGTRMCTRPDPRFGPDPNPAKPESLPPTETVDEMLERITPELFLEDWLKEADPAVRPRRRMERAILERTVDALLAAGYRIGVSLERGYDHDSGMLLGSRDRERIIEEAWAGDECHIFAQPAEGPLVKGQRVVSHGWVFLVYGNDGYDTISDYTTNLEAVLKPVNDYASTLGG